MPIEIEEEEKETLEDFGYQESMPLQESMAQITAN